MSISEFLKDLYSTLFATRTTTTLSSMGMLGLVVIPVAGMALLQPSQPEQQEAQTQQIGAPGGQAWAWGRNDIGQLGDGTTTNRNSPVQVSSLSGITTVAGGELHSLALKDDGTVWAWGLNDHGQLGDGTTTYRNSPVQVSGLSSVQDIAGGYRYSLALENDGTVWAWGHNHVGQLGDGTTTDRSTPVQVSGLSGVTAIDAGNFHSLALKDDGTVWAWGFNAQGQLGDDTNTDRNTPVQVKGTGDTGTLSGVTAIAGGGYHSLALKNDGAVWAWGLNNYSQLGGDGTTANRSTPVQVSGLSDVRAIAGGWQHSLALKNDGTVWAWGYYNYGQVQISGLSNVRAIAGGDGLSLALKNDGTVWAWGHNTAGQLGDGTNTERNSPVQVANLSGVTAIAAGWQHSLAVTGTTAPKVTSTVPTGTTPVDPTTTVEATFSEPVQNVSPETFILERHIAVKKTPPKYVRVDATVSPSADGISAVLTPVEDLPKGEYRATITTEVTDMADPANALEDPVVWTFTVAK